MSTRALGKMVVGNMLATAAIRFGDRTSFICAATGRRYTFRESNERCNRLAHALSGLGLQKGDVVAFLCTNRAEVPEIYFALAKAGLVGIPLNYRLASVEVVELMAAMGARALLYEARFAECAAAVRDRLPHVTRFVAIGATGGGDVGYEDFLAGAPATEPDVEIDEADPYYFNLTSGTTGTPKSYVLSHFNNCALGPMFAGFDTRSSDVFLTVFPLFGRVGFAWLAGGVMYGVPNVLMSFHPGEALALIEAERVTLVNLVATMGAMMLASDRLPGADLSSLRGVVYAGSMLPAPVREGSQARLSPNLYEYYGMQETGLLSLSTPEDRARRPDSVGRAALFAEARVVDDAGRPVPPGQIGEILGRSPSTACGYFQNPEKTAETFRDGWVHTGDLGSFDDEGYLFIRGRKKDLIITGGQNVHAAEVEETLLHHAGVAECAVIGLPDDLWGERVAAVVVPRPGASPTAEALEKHCRASLAGFKTPKQFVFRAEPLPRTPTGKVQKFLLVEQYG